MKMVKSLLLGTAAGLVAMSGAQAADLPVKAKPVQYVKICSLYGAGFYYIPGTDTCIKVGGYMRTEMNFNAGGSMNPYRAQNFDTPARNFQNIRTRAAATFDTRSQTEYGTLRSYFVVGSQYDNSNQTGVDGRLTPGGNPNGRLFSNAAFIQFAGFTIGQTASFFEFDQVPYTNGTAYVSSNQSGAGIWVAGYTAQLGNGLSASISAEDSTARQSSIVSATYVAPALYASPGGNGYGGRRWTDFVGNIRIDQAWGSAQVMGAVHDVYANNSPAAAAGITDTRSATGYALGAGAKLNLPMLGKGDYIQGQFTWSKGATSYVMQNSGFGGTNAYALSNGFPNATNTALGPVYDAVVIGGAGTSTGMDLTEAWGVSAGYEHNWVPGWKTSLYGGYAKVEYSDAASAAIAAQGLTGSGAAAGTPIVIGAGSASANYSVWQIGSRTTWTPVTNLDLSVDVVYSKVNTAFEGATTVSNGVTNTFGDKGFWAGMFRAQRNFYP